MDIIRQMNFPVTTAQVTGRQQLQQGGNCEDVIYSHESDDFCFYGVADGQSGKSLCTLGGREALIATALYLQENGISALSQSPFPDEIQYNVIRRIRDRISELSESLHTNTTELSSTLLALGLEKQTGSYILLHLGDGCAIGLKKDRKIKFISPPDNGITSRYTWLTTSDSAMKHLRIYFGKLSSYDRILLLTDGAECICRGKNIVEAARSIISGNSAGEICSYIAASCPADDASCIIIDVSGAQSAHKGEKIQPCESVDGFLPS